MNAYMEYTNRVNFMTRKMERGEDTDSSMRLKNGSFGRQDMKDLRVLEY